MKKVFYEKKRKYFLLAYCSSLIIHQIFAARGNSQFICQALMWITDEIMSVCCISLQYEREYWTVNCPICAFTMHKTRKNHKHRSCGCSLRSVLSIFFYFMSLKGKSVQELPLHLCFPARRKGEWKKTINFFMYKPAKGKMS